MVTTLKTRQPRIITCPACGEKIPIANSAGRKPLNLDVKFIYDTLRTSRSITTAAKKLGCSRGYIYKVLKDHGKTLDDILGD